MREITGVMIYYYFVCKRKLWYFYNDITMEQYNDLVCLGKLLDETTYSREKKNILIDNINIDFLKDWAVIHEIKKSRKIEEASIWQVKYYIYYLEQKGIHIEKGIIDYPLLKQREFITFDLEDEKKLKDIIQEIKSIVSKKVPIKEDKKKICYKCAYYELCFI